MQWFTIAGPAVCFAVLVFNICCLSILWKTKVVNNRRFVKLVLLLSISDSVVALEYITHVIIRTVLNDGEEKLYGCMAIKHLYGGTLCFSLYQTLMICMERLNKTFQPQIKLLKVLTSNVSVVVGFILLHAVRIGHFLLELRYSPFPCTDRYTLKPDFVVLVDGVAFFLCLMIITLYLVIIIRINHQFKQVHPSGGTELQDQNSQDTEMRRRFRSCVFTLGIIIVLTIVGNMPRIMVSLYSLFLDVVSPTVYTWAVVGNVMTLLNPMFDPVIYILRVKEYRKRLTCCKITL